MLQAVKRGVTDFCGATVARSSAPFPPPHRAQPSCMAQRGSISGDGILHPDNQFLRIDVVL
jgi:hypothetical protein